MSKKSKLFKASIAIAGALSCTPRPLPDNTVTKPKDIKPLFIAPEDMPDSLNYVNIQDAYKKGYCNSLLEFISKASYETEVTILNKDNYKSRLCAAHYDSNKDKVFMKVFIADTTNADTKTAEKILNNTKKFNDEFIKLSNLAHEYKHRDTQKAFIQQVTAEDFAKICHIMK